MIQEDVFKVLGDIASADAASYWIVSVLTLIAVLIMRSVLPVKSLALVFAPGIFWGGLTGVYAASMWGFVAVPDRNANIVATSTLGMIAALVAMMLLKRGVDAAMRIRRPVRRNVPAPVSARQFRV